MDTATAFLLMITVIVTASLSLAAICVWVVARVKERELYYRSEAIRKIAETSDPSAALAYLRESERIDAIRARYGVRLGGLILMAVGGGVMIFLYQLIPGTAIYLCGTIPLLIGVVMLVFGLGRPAFAASQA